MKIFILDTGDAFATDRFNTCFVIQDKNGNNLAIECPHPYMKILKHNEWRSEFPSTKNIDNILITHLHADHFGGLETFAFYKKFVEGKKLGLYVTENDREGIENALKPSMGNLYDGEQTSEVPFDFYFNTTTLQEKNEINFGGFEISIKKTKHYVPSCAILVKEENSSIAYSGDTMFDMDLIKWLNQADIILHEVGKAPGHTEHSYLCGLPGEIKNKIKLIHYGDEFYKRNKSTFPCLVSGNVMEKRWIVK